MDISCYRVEGDFVSHKASVSTSFDCPNSEAHTDGDMQMCARERNILMSLAEGVRIRDSWL